MICGNCKGHHLSVAEVRECYAATRDEARVPSPAQPPDGDAPAQPALPALGDPTPRLRPGYEPDAPIRPRPDSGPAGSLPGDHAPVGEGFYAHLGKIYKVQRAVHGSGHLYAKMLVPPTNGGGSQWVYGPGIHKQLTESMRLTREEAVRFGKLYGVCCICGRTLTNEDSIEAGIGPICAGKAGW